MNKIENNYTKVVEFFNDFEKKSKMVELGIRINSNVTLSNYLKYDVIIFNIVKFLLNENPRFFLSTNIFKTISIYLSAFINDGLSEVQITDFMLHLVDENKNHDFNKNLIDLVYIYNEEFYNMSYDDIRIIRNYLDFSPVINYARNHKRELLDNNFEEDLMISYSKMKDNMDVILSRIINNKNVHQEDIDECLIAFSNLNVAEEVLNCIYKTLSKRYAKRIEKSLNKRETTPIKKEVKKSHLITDKEYRSILKEIRKYFNPYTVQLTVEEISEEERNYVFSLMVKIGLNQNTIARFMNLTEKEEKHTYEYFKDHIDEFSYYYQDYMETLLDYYNELKNCLDEEKEFWINAINDALGKIKYDGKLDSYEYEIKKLKREGE